jgi:predicted flap endonuclease-1-like 5' DNA nuclease
MEWLSLAVGGLIGWGVEWVLDYLFWRRPYRTSVDVDMMAQQMALNDARARVRSLENKLTQYQGQDAELAALRTQVEDMQRLSRQLDVARAEITSLNEQLIEAQTSPPDNLRRIEGIGPKTCDLLEEHGIKTFMQLAETPVDRLRAILEEGGGRFRMADPATWPKQAQLAAEGDWDALAAMQSELVGGRKRKLVAVEAEATVEEMQDEPA